MITQKIDPADPILGFTVSWVRALAARVEYLHVLCLSRHETEALPSNVTIRSMGKEHGYNRVRELREFYRVLRQVVPDVDVILSHMIPRYAWLCAPYATAYHKPVSLWYTHRHANLELRLAMALCQYVLTASADSFPLRTRQLHVMGHGIDTEFFAPPKTSPAISSPEVKEGGPAALPLIVHVARVMPIKHQETLIRALATGIPARAAFVGAVPAGQDAGYLTALQVLTQELGVADQVTFSGGLTSQATRDLVCGATISVNLSPPGLFDKAALESMMMGIPTIVANPAFDSLVGEYIPQLRIGGPDDVQGLAERLRALLTLSSEQRKAMGMEIRARAVAEHSLDGLMDRMVKLMEHH